MLVTVDDLMPIGEFSERSGLSQKRLRSYAAAGLLVPAAVDSDNGYRYYSPGQLRDAEVIDALRRADVPLAVIATALHDPASFDGEQWARRLDDASAARREALTQARRLLPTDEAATHQKGRAMTRLMTSARTETGPVRANNEDAVIVAGERLVGVADGMGGPPGGEVASALAAAVVSAGFQGADRSELPAVTRSANAAIFAHAAEDSALRGMGTTLCAAGLLDDGTLAVVNVGDSRAYLVRDGELRRLTDDDTMTAELVRSGVIDEADAPRHPQRHVLTRVLGVGPILEVDALTVDVVDGDLVLVCTDGLSGAVDDAGIAEVVTRSRPVDELAADLVDLALSSGSSDNVTVVVAQVSATR